MGCWEKTTVLEKKSLVTIILLLIVLTTLIILIMVYSERNYCETPACIKSSERISSFIDFHQNPCQNVYNFVCGNFASHTHQSKIKSIINNEKTKSINKLKAMILEPINPEDPKSLTLQKLYYRSCTNLTAIEADNDATFWELLMKLGGWPAVNGNNWNESAFDFVELIVALRKTGLHHDWFFDISVHSNLGENLVLEIDVPDNANKIDDKVKQNYVNLMAEIAIAFGAHDYVAKLEMREVMFFEQKLASLIEEINGKNEQLYTDGPPKLTIAEVQTTWQKINWLEFLNQITNQKLSDHQQIAFYVGNYLPKLDKLLGQTSKRTQVNYVMWKLTESYAPVLSRKIREPVANYYQKWSTNQFDLWYKDRDAYCFEASKSFFQYAIEAAYLRRFVSRQKRKKIEEMVERIQVQMEKHLIAAKWMDDKTKKAAILKLHNISFIIGGPEEMYYVEQFDKYIGVENMELESSNIINISTEILAKWLDSVYGRKQAQNSYIKHVFYELVPSLETRFLRDYNLLYIPAGVLHEAFYDDDRPHYVNYGTIGTIIGHELTHGFDTGIFGNMTWWTNTTSANFETTIECLLDCTDGVGPDHLEMNCVDTLLENMADNTGINLSYEAYLQWLKENAPELILPGLDLRPTQLFWLAYGSLMCHVPVSELNDSRYNHMIPSYRIIGSFRNSPYFGKDFECELGSNMNPRNKCQIL